MKDYINLATFTFPHEILVLRSKFEESNITHYFQNEALIGLIPFSSFAFGGIKLMVHPRDITAAKEILDSFNDKSSSLRIV